MIATNQAGGGANPGAAPVRLRRGSMAMPTVDGAGAGGDTPHIRRDMLRGGSSPAARNRRRSVDRSEDGRALAPDTDAPGSAAGSDAPGSGAAAISAAPTFTASAAMGLGAGVGAGSVGGRSPLSAASQSDASEGEGPLLSNLSFTMSKAIVQSANQHRLRHALADVGDSIRELRNAQHTHIDTVHQMPDAPLPWLPLRGDFPQRLFMVFDDPAGCTVGKLLGVFILLTIFVASVAFCVESMTVFRKQVDTGQGLPTIFAVIEYISISVFTLDYLARLLTAWAVPVAYLEHLPEEGAWERGFVEHINAAPPTAVERERATSGWRKAWLFFKAPLNLLDLLAIVPFYLELVASSFLPGLAVIRTLRLTRLFRVFKVGKYSSGVQLLSRVMQNSMDALYLMVFFVCLACIVFGTMIFFAEAGTYDPTTGYYMRDDITGTKQEVSPFSSIPQCFYWVAVTATTVGFGDLVPTSVAGKIISGIVMHFGILALALPITVIGANFAVEYSLDTPGATNADLEADLDEVEQDRLMRKNGVPRRPPGTAYVPEDSKPGPVATSAETATPPKPAVVFVKSPAGQAPADFTGDHSSTQLAAPKGDGGGTPAAASDRDTKGVGSARVEPAAAARRATPAGAKVAPGEHGDSKRGPRAATTSMQRAPSFLGGRHGTRGHDALCRLAAELSVELQELNADTQKLHERSVALGRQMSSLVTLLGAAPIVKRVASSHRFHGYRPINRGHFHGHGRGHDDRSRVEPQLGRVEEPESVHSLDVDADHITL